MWPLIRPAVAVGKVGLVALGLDKVIGGWFGGRSEVERDSVAGAVGVGMVGGVALGALAYRLITKGAPRLPLL